MSDEERPQTIKIPAWAWAIMAGGTGFALYLLGSFFHWLGNTSVEQGKAIERVDAKVTVMSTVLTDVQDKVDDLPPAKLRELPVRVDDLERRMDRLENKSP